MSARHITDVGSPRGSVWRSGGPAVVGIWINTLLPAAAILAEHVGYDFVGWDCQHTPLDEGRVADLLRGSRMRRAAVLVRVSRLDDALIGKVADAGADAVLVPLISTAAEAAAAVAACRYPPQGRRSFGPMRPELRGLSLTDLAAATACFVLAETAEAVENIDGICATDALTGVIVGPKDLALSAGEEDPDRLRDLIHRIRKACVAADVAFGVAASSGTDAGYWSDQGADLVTVGADLFLLQGVLADHLGDARTTKEP